MRAKIKTISILTALLLAVFISSTASAQILPKFGVKAGANFTTFNNESTYEYKTGFTAGVFADLAFPVLPISIQPEILYSQYGTNIEDSDLKMNINYLQIPVLVKFGFPTPVVKPNVYFGPYYGRKLNANVKNSPLSSVFNDMINASDFGVVVGAGVNITKLRLDLRYTAGLTEVYDSNLNVDAKNGAFALTVGVAF